MEFESVGSGPIPPGASRECEIDRFTFKCELNPISPPQFYPGESPTQFIVAPGYHWESPAATILHLSALRDCAQNSQLPEPHMRSGALHK